MEIRGDPVALEVKTRYPWQGHVSIDVNPGREKAFSLNLRIPGWCRSARLEVNGRRIGLKRQRGRLQQALEWRVSWYSLLQKTSQNSDKTLASLCGPPPEVKSTTVFLAVPRRIATKFMSFIASEATFIASEANRPPLRRKTRPWGLHVQPASGPQLESCGQPHR